MVKKKDKPIEKCLAMKKNCGNIINNERCLYHFKDGETQCKICGATRSRCNNWPLKGSRYCRYHGGAGRPKSKMDTIILTPEEREEINRAEGLKLRHHERLYQEAWIRLKRVLDNINEKGDDVHEKSLAVLSGYFKNVEKVMSELKLEGIQGEHIQRIEFNELDEKQLNELKRHAFICGAQSSANAMLQSITNVIKDKVVVLSIVDSMPDIIKQFAYEKFKKELE